MKYRYYVHDKFPAYISWETFEMIQAMLHDNYNEYSRNKTRGVPREGKALLHGIMYCDDDRLPSQRKLPREYRTRIDLG